MHITFQVWGGRVRIPEKVKICYLNLHLPLPVDVGHTKNYYQWRKIEEVQPELALTVYWKQENKGTKHVRYIKYRIVQLELALTYAWCRYRRINQRNVSFASESKVVPPDIALWCVRNTYLQKMSNKTQKNIKPMKQRTTWQVKATFLISITSLTPFCGHAHIRSRFRHLFDVAKTTSSP